MNKNNSSSSDSIESILQFDNLHTIYSEIEIFLSVEWLLPK